MPTPVLKPPDAVQVRADVMRALAEDIGSGDITACLLPDAPAVARLHVREAGIMAGRDWFFGCFQALDSEVRIDWHCADGEPFVANQIVCEVHAHTRALVSAERSAINFLQTLCATASATAAFVSALGGTNTRVLDTRKTLPGLRYAQKYAVRAGGGCNHRMGLYDAIMIKENHVLAAGSIEAAISAARRAGPGLPVIVEVESLDELELALASTPDRIVLDDFDHDTLCAAVARAAGKVALEVSGGVDLKRARTIALTGVDFISVGSLTKHVHAIDFSLRLQPMQTLETRA